MSLTAPDIRFSVAPMMDWTDRHDRFFMRLMSKRARLYTEMVTADAVRYGNRDKLLAFNEQEHPLALQLGGSSPEALAEAAKIGEDYGYDEINLNVGCPSDRVQSGSFGACLMQEPDLVADCVAAMRAAVKLPITVKSRIGVDDQEPREALFTLVEKCKSAGITHFIVHARKAWLDGLSPKENRDIPPLDYELVYQLKRAHADLLISINGGIETLADSKTHLAQTDGVMLGRAPYKNPYLLASVDGVLFGDSAPPPTREEIVEQLIPYAETLVTNGTPLHALTRHVMGLFQGLPGGRLWRRHLSENAPRRGDDPMVLQEALQLVEEQKEKAMQRAG
ncbi:MAG: tRNA dihydrouridine(20/20a) synthase DusA [Alphaproteobacteria bacterium]|nr:tRNA dihydrouridine(20/20a) synthase DusA [Alphaproteobacteria bacterium]